MTPPFPDPDFVRRLQRQVAPFSDPDYVRRLQRQVAPFSDPDYVRRLQRQVAPFSDPEYVRNLRRQIAPLSDPGVLERLRRSLEDSPTTEQVEGLRSEAESLGELLDEIGGDGAGTADADAVADFSWVDRLPTAAQARLLLNVLGVINALVAFLGVVSGAISPQIAAAVDLLLRLASTLIDRLRSDAE